MSATNFMGAWGEITEAFAPDPMTGELMTDWQPLILIVDDDPEATIPVEYLFRSYGCESDFAYSAEEGLKRITSNWYDLIILDWTLDHGTGGELVRSVLANQSVFDKFRNRFLRGPQPIITFTAHSEAEIVIPENNYFIHVDHWRKPIRYRDIAHKVSKILTEIKS